MNAVECFEPKEGTEIVPTINNYVNEMSALVAAELPGLPADLISLYTLLAFVKGEKVTLVDVHDAWSIWCNESRPDHQSLIPFGELSREVQELDREYMEGIQRAVQEYQAQIVGRRQ